MSYGQHQARNGRHVLRFTGRVLGSASSEREDAARWSELVVYGLTNGCYIRSKIGYSLIAHRPECPLVDRHMTRWIDLDDKDESGRTRVPCVVCQPVIGASIDPLMMVESTRYTATMAVTAKHLAELLTTGRPGRELPRLVLRVLEQVVDQDPVFAAYWKAVSSEGVNVTP